MFVTLRSTQKVFPMFHQIQARFTYQNILFHQIYRIRYFWQELRLEKEARKKHTRYYSVAQLSSYNTTTLYHFSLNFKWKYNLATKFSCYLEVHKLNLYSLYPEW